MADNKLSPDDLTIDNLTPHVIKLSSNIESERLKFVFAKLIQYSHDFVRDTKLTTAEWEAAWQYLTEVRDKRANLSLHLKLTIFSGRPVLHARSTGDDPPV
jgi:hypothetical protein